MKNIVFLTGTRADFGKLKTLIQITQKDSNYNVHVFVTGMHMNQKYGQTINEIYKTNIKNIYPFINHDSVGHMDRILANTINGLSMFISQNSIDMIVVHGDRPETLAGAIVGSLNNIKVAHIEGGEISGTIDELIRHSVSKLSHIHLVSNKQAEQRLLQLGEYEHSIFNIGSPDVDLMKSDNLPTLNDVKEYYDIKFEDYSIALFHPVTTEHKQIKRNAQNFVQAMIESKKNYILVLPNNDLGSEEIIKEYQILYDNPRFAIFPSIRFEMFLTLLKETNMIIGNSSAGIREAEYYGKPTVDIGTRQNGRYSLKSIFNTSYNTQDILKTIKKAEVFENTNDKDNHFGDGNSSEKFLKLLQEGKFSEINIQKQLVELL